MEMRIPTVVYGRPYFYVAMRKLAEVPQARFLQNEMSKYNLDCVIAFLFSSLFLYNRF